MLVIIRLYIFIATIILCSISAIVIFLSFSKHISDVTTQASREGQISFKTIFLDAKYFAKAKITVAYPLR